MYAGIYQYVHPYCPRHNHNRNITHHITQHNTHSTTHTAQHAITKHSQGITFVTNAHVGRNVDIKNLLSGADAIVLAAGATKPRDLKVDGRCVCVYVGGWVACRTFVSL